MYKILTLCARCLAAPPGPGAWAGGRCETCATAVGPHAPRVEPACVVWRPSPPKWQVDQKLTQWIAKQQRRGTHRKVTK